LHDTTFSSEFAFKIGPEAFEAINKVTVCHIAIFAVLNKTMKITLGGDSGVSTPGI
jgi:hypothetical protein